MRNGWRKWIWLNGLLALVVIGLGAPWSVGAEGDEQAHDVGPALAAAALAYADVTYGADGEERQGVPYVWGGRTALDAFVKAGAEGDGGGEGLAGLGVDASGLVVAALRDVLSDVRFYASADGQVLWTDATSELLYQFNVVSVPPEAVKAGDLLFFGHRDEAGAVRVGGVAVVTGRSGTRVDFVVASAGQGRVIHTFARTDGDYWRANIVGSGRLALPAP